MKKKNFIRKRITTFPGSIVGTYKLHLDGIRGKGVTVVVIDNEMDNHVAINKNNRRDIISYGPDFSGADPELKRVRLISKDLEMKHSTHIVGIIAGDYKYKRLEFRGVAPDCDIIHFNIYNERTINTTLLTKALNSCVDNQAVRVINLSFTIALDDHQMQTIGNEIERIVNSEKGRTKLFCCAVGNTNGNINFFKCSKMKENPFVQLAANDNVMLVGVSTNSYFLSDKGLLNSHISVFAPGQKISSLSGFYAADGSSQSGSSMSTAFVSGIAALLFGIDRDLNPKEVKEIISKSGVALKSKKEFEQYDISCTDGKTMARADHAVKYYNRLKRP